MLSLDSLVKVPQTEVSPFLTVCPKFLPGCHPVEWACLLQL